MDIAIFSFSVTKTISSGQGGAITTNDERLAKKLKALRTHGLDSVFNPKAWPNLGFNFRMTDLTACVGLHQLKMIEAKISGLKSTYDYYRKRLDMIKTGNIELIPVRVDQGEIPQYIEVHSHRGNDLQAYLSTKGIETRPFFPPLSSAPYIISEEHGNWLSPNISESHFIIPSGPDRSEAELSLVCDEIGKFFGE